MRIKPLAKQVAASMPAVAVTDRANLFALVKFYRAALTNGVKPLVGVDLRIVDSATDGGREREPARAILLVKDEAGYLNLTRLVSRSFQEGRGSGEPVCRARLGAGGQRGPDRAVGRHGGRRGAGAPTRAGGGCARDREALAGRLRRRYYLELTRCGRPDEEACLNGACAIAVAAGIPVVATNDVRFPRRDRLRLPRGAALHRRRAGAGRSKRPKNVTSQQYLKTPAEMAVLFADLPVALDNALEIARRCQRHPQARKAGAARLPDSRGHDRDRLLLRALPRGLEERARALYDTDAADFAETRKPYDARLQRELDVIAGMGFPGYS